METQAPASKPLHPLAWVAGIALIVFSAVGVGAFMGWIPSSMSGPKDEAVLDETPAAYKDIDAVMAAQADLVDVVHTLKQVVCVKG